MRPTSLRSIGQYTSLRQRGKKHVAYALFTLKNALIHRGRGKKGLYHCFGCGRRRRRFHLRDGEGKPRFSEAVAFLRRNTTSPCRKRSAFRPKPSSSRISLRRSANPPWLFLKTACGRRLRVKKPWTYLKERGLAETVIEGIPMGYAPNAWDGLTGYFKRKGVAPALLE
jgi:DNA primase